MKASAVAPAIAEELRTVLSEIDDAQVRALTDRILGARAVFLTGAGRSLLMAKCCAMRLMQLGLTAYVPGEVVTPAVRPGDLLVVVSGSGETDSVVLMAKKAKKAGADVALITMVPDSTLGRLADSVLLIRGKSSKVASGRPSIQIGGGLFELSALLVLETVALMAAEGLHLDDPDKILMQNHANLE